MKVNENKNYPNLGKVLVNKEEKMVASYKRVKSTWAKR